MFGEVAETTAERKAERFRYSCAQLCSYPHLHSSLLSRLHLFSPLSNLQPRPCNRLHSIPAQTTTHELALAILTSPSLTP